MAPFNNSCLASAVALQPPTRNAPQTFLEHCPQWVIDTTDAVWSPGRTAEAVNRSLHEHFYAEWETTSTFGKKIRGMASLEKVVWGTKKAFPDLRIHITDVTCIGNDIDGYKTIMPDVLVGTHTGFSEMYGQPTNRSASWAGLAFCYVQKVHGRWQYVAEWVVHDELSTALQLGVMDRMSLPETRSEPHDCAGNLPSWGWTPDKAHTIVQAASVEVPDQAALDAQPAATPVPPGKRVVIAMDQIIMDGLGRYDYQAWSSAMAPFWTDRFLCAC